MTKIPEDDPPSKTEDDAELVEEVLGGNDGSPPIDSDQDEFEEDGWFKYIEWWATWP